MGVKIRILNSANRTMQRAGFLKLLCAQTARVETTNLQSLGKHFVGTLIYTKLLVCMRGHTATYSGPWTHHG